MIPEVGWMFGDDLAEDVIDALVCMDAVQWALIAMMSRSEGERVL